MPIDDFFCLSLHYSKEIAIFAMEYGYNNFNQETMGFTATATLELKNDDDFRRVLEFVKPDESDTEPQTDEEYGQVMNIYDNLSFGS